MIDHVLGLSTVVIPAYGRVYKTSGDAVADWRAGKDFKVAKGPYCSVRDVGVYLNGPVHVLWNRVDAVRVV